MADPTPTPASPEHLPPPSRRVQGADWLQADSLAGQPVPDGPPTLAAPPWVGPDLPPTLGHVHLADHPLPKPEIPGYEITRELGRGGMGVVYKARQVGLNRWVALKMILGGAHAGSKDLARFQAEAEAVAQLRHPNIVQIHEIGTHQGLPFLALEFIDGGSLYEQIGGTPQPPREAAGLVATLARAMHAAHLKGILHRDLKPANILLERKADVSAGRDGKHTSFFARFAPRITDFGLAKRLEGSGVQTKSDEILGTPSYMSPEQAASRRQEIGPASDVYSLGAILYEMLTGFPPFRGAAPIETVLLVLTTEPAPPRRFRPAVPRDLETICLKCLHKDPRRRYATAEALAEDLRRFLYGEAIHARPVSRGEKAWRWCRRNPTVTFLVATVFLLAVSGTVTWVRNATQQRQRQEENERQVHLALGEALRLRGDAKAAGDMTRFGEALGAARRAKTHLAQGVADPQLAGRADQLLRDLEREERSLRDQRQQQARDRRLLAQLEEARLRKATLVGGQMPADYAAPAYHQAFREYGANLRSMPLPQAIEHFRNRPICLEVAAALDDWAEVNAEPPALRRKLRQLAEAIDPDPWRNKLRVALQKESLAEIITLADSADMAKVAPASLVLLGNRLRWSGELDRAVAFYRRAQWQHSSDFWINLNLGLWLAHQQQFAEACRFYGIAAAVKPEHLPGHFLLALSLLQQRRYEEAILGFRKCLMLQPNYVEAHGNLGLCLQLLGRLDEAEAAFRRAIALDPGRAGGWYLLGRVLVLQGEFAEALECYRTAAPLPADITLIPNSSTRPGAAPPPHLDLRLSVAECERLLALDQRCRDYLTGLPEAVPPADVLMLARFSKERKHHPALAARLYAQAFQRDAALAEAGTHRFAAACAAALAGTGQGKDAPLLTDAERQRWWQQALAWLQADLAALQARRKDAPLLTQQRLESWRKNPDLAALREPARLKQLPDQERRTWVELWKHVDDLLPSTRD